MNVTPSSSEYYTIYGDVIIYNPEKDKEKIHITKFRFILRESGWKEINFGLYRCSTK